MGLGDSCTAALAGVEKNVSVGVRTGRDFLACGNQCFGKKLEEEVGCEELEVEDWKGGTCAKMSVFEVSLINVMEFNYVDYVLFLFLLFCEY